MCSIGVRQEWHAQNQRSAVRSWAGKHLSFTSFCVVLDRTVLHDSFIPAEVGF